MLTRRFRLRLHNPLPPKPAILHGRAQELQAIVEMIVHKAPAHVAVLGSGGIGKTTVALAALHDPEVERLFLQKRFFVPCDAAATAEALAVEVLKVLGLPLK